MGGVPSSSAGMKVRSSLGRGRRRLSLFLFLSPATFPPVPFNTLSVSLMPPPRAEEETQRGSPESGGGPSSAPPPLGPSPWIPFASVNVALSQCLHRTVEGVKGTLWVGRRGGRHPLEEIPGELLHLWRHVHRARVPQPPQQVLLSPSARPALARQVHEELCHALVGHASGGVEAVRHPTQQVGVRRHDAGGRDKARQSSVCAFVKCVLFKVKVASVGVLN